VIKALDRKLLRDLARLKAQGAAIALVVASGVALFVASGATYRSLRLSEHRYYENQRFAHVWARLARAPHSVVRELAALPGVVAVEGRLVADAVLDIPGLAEPASGLVVAIPSRAGHSLNDLYVRRGRHVEFGRPREVLVSEGFAEKNGLVPGDSIVATVAGQRLALRVVGFALSPEQVMVIPPGGVMPDDRRFGVFWMEQTALASVLGMSDAINEIALRVANPAREAAVIAGVDRILDPYGGLGAYGRANQPSHVNLEDHINQLKGLTVVVPAIFLIVAAFLVNMVLSRLVGTQRPQIGMLKAFGYSNARIALHYLELAIAVVSVGILIGLPVGAWLGRLMAVFYATFFRFPVLVFRVEPALVASGAGVTLVAAVSGALGTLRRVATMTPVAAMAAVTPIYRPTMLARLTDIAWVSPAGRMIIRNVSRLPTRAGLTALGMALAVALLVLGETSVDSITRIIDVQFGTAQREDLSVALASPRSLERWRDFERLPAVRRAEPYRLVPARIRRGSMTQDVALRGLTESGVLRHILDSNFLEQPIPPEGVVLGTWLAERFDIHRGDALQLELRERRRRTVTVHVVALVDEPLGAGIYMSLPALGRLLEEPATFSGVNLLVDSVQQVKLYDALKRAPQVKAVGLRRGAVATFRSMSDTTLRFIRKIVVVFSVIIAFGVVYNTARISLAERGHELATLRVLGFTRGEVSAALLGEIGVLAMLSVPVGFAIGRQLSAGVLAAMSSERFRMPLIIDPPVYAFAFLVFTGAALVSALLVKRQLDRLNLVEALKARE
jgi:putative ABC transport system permease protein